MCCNVLFLPTFRLEGRVAVMLKKAFWDIFEENISKPNPDFNQAFVVFMEMKKVIHNIIDYNITI